jgi:hypothetical protein
MLQAVESRPRGVAAHLPRGRAGLMPDPDRVAEEMIDDAWG